VEASAARLLSRRPARRPTTASCLTSNGDDAERGRLDCRASDDEALDARDAGRRADAQHLSGHPRRIARLRRPRGWLDSNPLATVKRASKRHERELILRRDDFYDTQEVDCLLKGAPSVFEEAFWLCGAHAGLRLPGEALGLRWGAVDFQTGVIRPYDNWVRNEMDTTKTSDSEAIPMAPRLKAALSTLRQRGYATGDPDFVFVSELTLDTPVSERPIREAFKVAVERGRLKPIKMYNLRRSFGTTLARNGVDIRTIQALMRHDRLSTTEQYMAYSPRPDLAAQIARALDPHSPVEDSVSVQALSGDRAATFFERLEEDIPAKWLREVQRLFAETGALSS
jgi:integrase